jgi:TonB family protein
MTTDLFDFHFSGLRRKGAQIIYAAAMILALSVPASAADTRAILSRVPPAYPEMARRMRITGEVKLSVTVDADGKVTDIKEIGGNHMLSIAAEDAVRKWKFAPGDGVSTVEVALNFAL